MVSRGKRDKEHYVPIQEEVWFANKERTLHDQRIHTSFVPFVI